MQSIAHAARKDQTIPPFWLRLPDVLSYPANSDSMVKICCYGLGAVLASVLIPVLGVLIAIGIWVAFLGHAFTVLERTSRGHLTAADYVVEGDGEGDSRPIKQMGLMFVVMVLVAIVGGMMGALAAQIAFLILSLVLPASIMVLALEESLSAALNPARVAFFIRGIGMPYLALCAFLFLMLQGCSFLMGLLGMMMPFWMSYVLVTMVAMYFVVAMYYLMGYVLYQYHHALEVDVDVAPAEAARAVTKNPVVELLGPETQTLLEQGELREASRRIETRLNNEWDNHKLHDQYLRILSVDNQDQALADHTARYLPKLVSERRLYRAVEIYEACAKKVPDWVLGDGNLVLPLAQQAAEMNRPNTALALVKGFDRRYPGHRDIPSVYMVAGKVLMEHLHQYDAARRIFAAILEKYAGERICVDAERFQAMCDGMLAKTAAAPSGPRPTP